MGKINCKDHLLGVIIRSPGHPFVLYGWFEEIHVQQKTGNINPWSGSPQKNMCYGNILIGKGMGDVDVNLVDGIIIKLITKESHTFLWIRYSSKSLS